MKVRRRLFDNDKDFSLTSHLIEHFAQGIVKEGIVIAFEGDDFSCFCVGDSLIAASTAQIKGNAIEVR